MAEGHLELGRVFVRPSRTVDDARGAVSRSVGTPYTFPGYTRAEWKEKAAALRRQIRVATGLLPEHEPAPLNAEVFARIERKGYTVEKVHFEPFPGFLTTGNLYRPKGKSPPFPGIVSPHGHWKRGRLEDNEVGSIPARCINFARQGYVVFTYDMIGYNDSARQIEHRYGGAREALWGLSAMALQLRNGIDAVDFLQSLPEVDPERIGCTGASGGGTQTFILAAVDQRIKVAAPVNMISATMQGGCLCENAPNLRLEASNLEIGALMAPRPLLLVSATGDWTARTPTVEFPAIRSIYAHFDALDRVHHVQVDAEHNYNRESREAVYGWFAQWLLGAEDPSGFGEAPYEAEPDEALLVFSGRGLPAHALKQEEILPAWVNRSRQALARRNPGDELGHRRFREEMGTALRHALGLHLPERGEVTLAEPEGAFPTTHRRGYSARHLVLGRRGVGDAVPAILFSPDTRARTGPVVVVVHPRGKEKLIDAETGEPLPLVADLLSRRRRVLAIDVFATGEHGTYSRPEDKDKFTTYNRTTAALRVQDILTALLYFSDGSGASEVSLICKGEAGLWGLLAAGFAHTQDVVVDAAQFDNGSDDAYLKTLPIPCLRRAGDFGTAGALVAPRDLVIHNTGRAFDAGWIEEAYRSLGAGGHLLVRSELMPDAEIAASLGGARHLDRSG